jgi:hypothetical protein
MSFSYVSGKPSVSCMWRPYLYVSYSTLFDDIKQLCYRLYGCLGHLAVIKIHFRYLLWAMCDDVQLCNRLCTWVSDPGTYMVRIRFAFQNQVWHLLQLPRTPPTNYYLYECNHIFHILKIEGNDTPHHETDQLNGHVAYSSHLWLSEKRNYDGQSYGRETAITLSGYGLKYLIQLKYINYAACK